MRETAASTKRSRIQLLKGPPSRPRSPRTRAILEATVELLQETGYERLTIDAIAARAGASKATIYRHWEGKRDLVMAAFRQLGAADPGGSANAGSLRADLLELLRLIRRLVEAGDARVFSDLLAVSQRDPVIAQAIRYDLVARQRRECLDLLQRAVGRGELSDGGAGDLLFDLILGQVIVHAVVRGEQLSDDFNEQLVDDVLLPVLTRKEP